MIDQYIETALWSSNDESDESGGNPMDQNYSTDDIAPETLEQMQRDCDLFLEKCGDLVDGIDESDLGHDFWLTRNGHGAGFWDGDYEKSLGDKLTEISKEFGETNLYVGDDNLIYQM